MSMNTVVIAYELFNEGDRSDRRVSETVLMWLMTIGILQSIEYLERHPDTPKLYDSGVRYALPEQLTRKVPQWKLDNLRQYLRKNVGADDETIDRVVQYLRGVEVFRDIPTLYKKGFGDCDNCAIARCAELQFAGVKATPLITWRPTGNVTTYHALVRWPDGTSEDPSILLGMGGDKKAVDRAEERRKNQERHDTFAEAGLKMVMAGASADEIGKKIDMLGLIPKKGWK